MKPPTQSPCRCLLVGLLLVGVVRFIHSQTFEIPHQEVENWAWRFGRHLYELSKKMTNLDEINQKYNSAKLETRDPMTMVKQMVNDIEDMLKWKMQAVQRITDTAQQAMKGHEFEQDITFDYYNAKEINDKEKFSEGLEMILTPNKRFNNIPVNTTHSTIHVATNVYTKDVLVLNAIKGTEYLNPTFISNYQLDPTSLWQYFGSVTGFLRNFPGVKWLMDGDETDIYDCRIRPWYIEAASSPKDMVILLDSSGSMTGLRQEIAKHVVQTILDTLNANDFVAVYRFSENVTSVVDCFRDYLVPANRENIEVFKEELNRIKYEDIANFTDALITAFELLQRYNDSGEGSQCNQAIMLVTDGSPDTYDDIFNQYNQPHRHVRVFTYLIGREVTEFREVQYMACAHRGYYTHVKTLAEVREQVEKYVPVMARPMVIQKKHNYIWTPVYADITDPKISKWLYTMRERAKKKSRILRRMKEPVVYDEELAHPYELDGSSQEDKTEAEVLQEDDSQNELRNCDPLRDTRYCGENVKYYQLMTTVAAPVFDLENATKKANLLGVAGTDIPIKEILKLAPAYQIGVNGYPFITTNNGHLLCHPDLRPMFGDLLKLDYSTVDLSEVELKDSNLDPWEKDPEIMLLRQKMIDRETDKMKIRVRTHYDKMKRVITRTNQYYFTPIKQTPFSFGIALPEGYGEYKAKAEIDIKGDNFEALSTLEGKGKWKVHPDWVYCNYRFPGNRAELSPEANVLQFLQHVMKEKGENKERFQRVIPPLTVDYSENSFISKDKNEYYCDKELLKSLLFDAKATNVYGKKSQLPTDHNDKFAKRNGVSITFVATRSGLTRWEDLLGEDELGNLTEPHFAHLHNRAIDETWYKRAVDQYFINNTSFVFSVPFDANQLNDTYVTGSHAIFVEGHNSRAPVAVVGLQFKHSVFAETFMNFTSNCQSKNCATNCSSDDLDCYLLDDNGFVIVSENYKNTGKFFGEVDGLIMHSLIIDGIYQGVRLYDFQGICQEQVNTSNSASFILKPLDYILNLFSWVWKKFAVFWLEYNLFNLWNYDWLMFASATDDESSAILDYIHKFEMFNMKFRSCDKNFTLYRFNPQQMKMKPLKAKLIKCNPNGCDRPFSAQQVPYTNLVLLAVDATCPCESSQVTSIMATEVKYPNRTKCEMQRTALHRRRPTECYNYHPDELEIKDCGRGTTLQLSILLFLLSLILSLNTNVHLWS